MPNYQALSKATHGNKRWLRTTSYAFAQKDALLPLSLAELPKAVMSLPVAFIQRDDGFIPVAVMSIQPDRNHFITNDGRWLHGYIPASCRAYPFRFFNTPEGQKILCIDQDSGLVCEGTDGEPFFDEAGEPTQAIREILNFLHQSDQSLKATQLACNLLKQHNLIKPWPIKLKTETGEKNIEGLFQIDEAAVNQLSAEALLDVRNSGGLLIAYCQLLSMQHLSILGQLAQAHAKADQAAAEAANDIAQNGELKMEFLNKSETLSFSGF
ncbi:MAG: SapC family protein [Rhodocyclaceae bacterium]|nr:SapC family protein [Rhodocyclaceae bacterium]